MRRLSSLVLVTTLLVACAPAQSSEHVHHVTTPTINVDGAVPAPYGGTSLNSPLPESLLSLTFTDSDNRTFTLADYADKTVVISNFLTSCQDSGPMTSKNIFAAARALSKSSMKDQVIFIEITVDAQTDTPARLAAYRKLFGFDSNVILATSDAKSLEKLWKYFGAPATKHELSPQEIKTFPHDWQTGAPAAFHFMHANIVAVVDANSTWRWMQSGSPDIEARDLPEAMRAFLSPNGVAVLQQHDEFSWRVSQVISAIEDVMGHPINS